MAIKELTSKTLGKHKTGWHWDRKRELWTTWQVDATFNGSRHIRRGFRTEREAKDYLKNLRDQERLAEIGVVQLLKFPTLKALLEKYLETIKVRRDHTTASRVCQEFLSGLPSGLKINELKRKHFKDYADRRAHQGVKNETVFREITYLSSPLHKAGDYFEGLESWQPPENLIYRPEISDEGRSRVVSRDERVRLIQYLLRERQTRERERDYRARRRTGLIVWFAPLTGLRHGEIAALKKSDFNRQERKLVAVRHKTRKKKGGAKITMFEPLTDTHLFVLAEAEKLYPEGEYFFSDRGEIQMKTYDILEAACRDLKIPYGKNTPGGFIIHDLRHTFVTLLEQGSIDSSTTRSFSGHSTDQMMKHYAHATVDSRARAMQVIEKEVGIMENGNRETELQNIFKAAAAGEIDYEEFKNRLGFVYGFFT